jgi:hypothetical protein
MDIIFSWDLDVEIGHAVKRLFNLKRMTNGTPPINVALDVIGLIHTWIDKRQPPKAEVPEPVVEYSDAAHKVEVTTVGSMAEFRDEIKTAAYRQELADQLRPLGGLPQVATIEEVVESHERTASLTPELHTYDPVRGPVHPVTGQPTCIRYGCEETKELTSFYCAAHYDEMCRGGGCGE